MLFALFSCLGSNSRFYDAVHDVRGAEGVGACHVPQQQSASTEKIKSHPVQSPSVALVQAPQFKERWYPSGSQATVDHVVEGGMAW